MATRFTLNKEDHARFGDPSDRRRNADGSTTFGMLVQAIRGTGPDKVQTAYTLYCEQDHVHGIACAVAALDAKVGDAPSPREELEARLDSMEAVRTQKVTDDAKHQFTALPTRDKQEMVDGEAKTVKVHDADIAEPAK